MCFLNILCLSPLVCCTHVQWIESPHELREHVHRREGTRDPGRIVPSHRLCPVLGLS